MTNKTILISSSAFSQAQLLKKLPPWRHVTVLPWISAYLAVAAYTLSAGEFDISLIIFSAVITLHLLTCMVVYYWSVSAMVYGTYSKSSPEELELERSTHIYLVPRPGLGGPSVVPILYSTGKPAGLGLTKFSYLEKVFIWSTRERRFLKASWPLSSSISFDGISTDADLQNVLDVFGKNSLNIPVPTFLSLFKEHAVAPFFVFQVACVILWMADTFWYHSLMTLLMLVVFESTVVFQRLKSLREIKSMAAPPVKCMIRRHGKWIEETSESLLPGDIAGIPSGTSGIVVPADMLLLGGSVILNEALLTGESTPCVKEGISVSQRDAFLTKTKISVQQNKTHVLYSGTQILQAVEPETGIPAGIGVVGLVLRIGFSTTQGKLVRTMCLGRDRLSANNKEAGLFLLFLLFFAIIAAIYVWFSVLAEDPSRSRWRLLVQCLLIVTAVVPPELPMELSMAVNTSLAALSKLAIFCTEPFRLPLAGCIDVCCFDKTGTLTDTHLTVLGITGLDSDAIEKTLPPLSALVMGTCHSLAMLNGKAVGDPLEMAALQAVGWKLGRHQDTVSSGTSQYLIKKRWPFIASLKRMSALVEASGGVERALEPIFGTASKFSCLVCKGAPEEMYPLIKDPPEWYTCVAEKYASEGCRVITLALKKAARIISSRASAESDLIFAGFLVFGTSLRKEAARVIRLLSESHHKNVMITGDHALTAMHVAKCLNIASGYTLIDVNESSELVCSGQNCSSVEEIPELTNGQDFAITGNAFDMLVQKAKLEFVRRILPRTSVFARFSPSNKEDVLVIYKEELEWKTLMCGDGTNDVGALKQAHIGIALLDGKPGDLEKLAKRSRELARLKRQEELQKLQRAWGVNTPAENIVAQLDDDDIPVLQFGDASVAAPFTSKIGTLESVCHVLRQGRCTLSTTFQMYKILALNSLISAFSLSVLHLSGVRESDFQMTISGILLAACFLFLSRSEPLSTLSRSRPASTIFTLYSILSILGQFSVHMTSLYYLRWKISIYEAAGAISSEDLTFSPSLMNSCVYLLCLMMQISTFAINYQGPPFRESILENKGLIKSLCIVSGLVWLAASELMPDFNAWLQIVPFPSIEFRWWFMCILLVDVGLAYLIETISKALFSNVSPKWMNCRI